jgi:hypothetical protein
MVRGTLRVLVGQLGEVLSITDDRSRSPQTTRFAGDSHPMQAAFIKHLIGSRVLEQLVCVPQDAGCSREMAHVI